LAPFLDSTRFDPKLFRLTNRRLLAPPEVEAQRGVRQMRLIELAVDELLFEVEILIAGDPVDALVQLDRELHFGRGELVRVRRDQQAGGRRTEAIFLARIAVKAIACIEPHARMNLVEGRD